MEGAVLDRSSAQLLVPGKTGISLWKSPLPCQARQGLANSTIGIMLVYRNVRIQDRTDDEHS